MDSSNTSCAEIQNQELEAKIQELYTANRKIELLQANIAHLEQEVEWLKKALEERNVLLEEAKKSDVKSKSDELLRQNISDLKQELHKSQQLEKTVREENARLENRLQQVLENYATNISVAEDDTGAQEMIDLGVQVELLREEKRKQETELMTLSANLQQQTDENTRLRHEMSEKDEELECMESQFSTQCEISARLREENHQLQDQIESEEGQMNVAKKGNSLFSEVEDRRVAAESKVVQINEQMKSLEEVLAREQKENKRLKTQIMYLRHNSKRGFDEEAVTALQTQLLQAKKTIVDLTDKLAKLEISPKASPVTHSQSLKSSSLSATDEDKSFINFLEGLIRTKTKEISDVKSQAHASRQQSVRMDLDLTQANNELRLLRHEISQLKQRNSHLSLTLQDMKHKYGEDSPDLWSPDRRPKRQSGKKEGSSPVAPPGNNLSSSERKENLPSESLAKTGPTSRENKPIVCLRDLYNDLSLDRSRGGGKPDKSCGVQLSQEVTVTLPDGKQSTAELRADGKVGKLKRTQGKEVKSVKVTYPDAAEVSPPECKQQ